MKLTLPVLALFVGLLSPFAHAIEVLDPYGILPLSDQFVGKADFDQAFRPGDRGWGQTNRCQAQCNASGCQTLCDPPESLQFSVLEANREAVIIRNSAGDGGSPKDSTISRLDWEATNGNFVRAFVMGKLPTMPRDSGFDGFDSVSFDRWQQTSHYLSTGLTSGWITALDVWMTYSTKFGETLIRWPVKIRVGRSAMGVGQLLQLDMLVGMSAPPSLRLDGLFLSPR